MDAENLVNIQGGILLRCGICSKGAQKWTELETIMLDKLSQIQEDKHRGFPQM